MASQPLRGSLEPLALTGILITLQRSASSGALRLEREGVVRDLYFRDGSLIAAASSSDADSLEWILFTAGILSHDRREQVHALIEDGARRGAALVEHGGIDPETLFRWEERRLVFLVRDLLCWNEGTFEFGEGAEPEGGTITFEKQPVSMLLEALRDGIASSTVDSLMPAGETVLRPLIVDGEMLAMLRPHERYVLSLVDGRRTVAHISRMSELGEPQTLASIARLSSCGYLRPEEGTDAIEERVPGTRSRSAGEPVRAPLEAALGDGDSGLPAGDSQMVLRSIVRIYNEKFIMAGAYMYKEIGPIAEQLLEKNLMQARARHPAVFHRVTGTKDGSLPEETITRNLGLIKEQDPREILLQGLHDYLAGILHAVRRMAGSEHEMEIARKIKDLHHSRI